MLLAQPWVRGTIHSLLGGSDGMDCGHESLYHAKMVMDDLGQWGGGEQAVGGTGGTADNLEEVVIILMVQPRLPTVLVSDITRTPKSPGRPLSPQ